MLAVAALWLALTPGAPGAEPSRAPATDTAPRPATAPTAPLPLEALKFRRAGNEFRFDTGVLRGTLRAGGASKGLGPIEYVPTGKSLAGPYGLLSPYRLLTPKARFGTAAWDWASDAQLRSDGAVRVQWKADAEHPLDLTAVYRLTAANSVDVQLTVTPHQELNRFEVFLASYFDGFPQSFAYARSTAGTGDLIEAKQADGYWQAFPRDPEAITLIRDGRWHHPPNPVDWEVRSQLAGPLGVRRNPLGLTAMVMAPAADCFAVMMPYGAEPHGSLYLCLIGRDLAAAKPATATARLTVAADLDTAAILAAYRRHGL